MKYHRARKLIKTGDLLAFQGTWLMSKGIQWFTHSNISHVGIACWIDFHCGYREDYTVCARANDCKSKPLLCLFESMEGANVRVQPLYKTLETLYWPKGGKAYWKSLQPNYDGKDLMDFCVEHWIDSYASVYQFLLIASPRLRWLRKFRGGNVDNVGYHCSELIATGLKEQGYDLPKDPPALITPGDLYNLDCFNPVGVELEYSSRKQVFGYRYPS